MKKLIFLFLFTIFCLSNAIAFDELNYYRNNKYYGVFLKDTAMHNLAKPFTALNVIERDQVHKIMLDNMEKSRIMSLAFVGDKYEFNGVELQSVLYRGDRLLLAGKQYKITDKTEQYSVIFSVGDYDTIVLHSYLEFVTGRKEPVEDIDNKYATIFTVKNMLARITGTIITVYDLPRAFSIGSFENDLLPKIDNDKDRTFFINSYKNNGRAYILLDTVSIEEQKLLLKIYNDAYATKGYNAKERMDKLDGFIAELRLLKEEQIFENLCKYVSLNIRIVDDDYRLTGMWQSPWEVYYSGLSDAKSVCLFYYYVLSRLDFNVKAFFVEDLIYKPSKPVRYGKNANINDEIDEKKQYKNVSSEFSQIKQLYEYNPPDIGKAVMLVAVEKNINGVKHWEYTTGTKWKKCNSPQAQRVCPNFTKGGCYYADVSDKEYHILHNYPIEDGFVKWSVFF